MFSALCNRDMNHCSEHPHTEENITIVLRKCILHGKQAILGGGWGETQYTIGSQQIADRRAPLPPSQRESAYSPRKTAIPQPQAPPHRPGQNKKKTQHPRMSITSRPNYQKKHEKGRSTKGDYAYIYIYTYIYIYNTYHIQ